MPTAFPNLRTVPAYQHFLKERFERCLVLYLAPRQRKMKMNVNKEDLIPKLPSPKDLQPFPTFQGKQRKLYFILWKLLKFFDFKFQKVLNLKKIFYTFCIADMKDGYDRFRSTRRPVLCLVVTMVPCVCGRSLLVGVCERLTLARR